MRKNTTHKLKNGLRVITVELKDFHSMTTFLAIKSGSRYELPNESGITHFLEHMVFKGTEKYPSTAQIAQALEGVGGNFNAWTSVDHTVYYNIVPKNEWQTGLEIPFQLAYRALLREKDLERERGVIIEEMKMIKDDPARYIYDISQEILFDNHSLGQSVIGNETTINSIQSDLMRSYRDSHYSMNQSVLAVVGSFDQDRVIESINNQVKDLQSHKNSNFQEFNDQSSPKVKLVTKETDQTHFVLALAHPSLSLKSQDLYTAKVLNTVLGRGMSSRLFLRVREEKGLAYSISSDVSNLEETGALSVSGGINTDKFIDALEAIEKELEILTKEKVNQTELEKAKKYLIGSYDMKSDQPLSLARNYALDELLSSQKDFEEIKEKIAQVNSDQVLDLAQKLFRAKNRTLAIIGPQKSDQQFQRFVGN